MVNDPLKTPSVVAIGLATAGLCANDHIFDARAAECPACGDEERMMLGPLLGTLVEIVEEKK